MAITDQQILKKIITESQQALHNQAKVREHAKAIQSLTDLLLDQDSSSSASPAAIEEVEWQKMTGESAPRQQIKQEKKIEEDEENGNSLLDF